MNESKILDKKNYVNFPFSYTDRSGLCNERKGKEGEEVRKGEERGGFRVGGFRL